MNVFTDISLFRKIIYLTFNMFYFITLSNFCVLCRDSFVVDGLDFDILLFFFDTSHSHINLSNNVATKFPIFLD